MEIPTVKIFGVSLASTSLENTIKLIDNAILSRTQIRHVQVNARKLVNMKRQPELRKTLNSTHILHAQGKALFWASKVYNKFLPKTYLNQELIFKLIEGARKKKQTIYFLGGQGVTVNRLVHLVQREYHKDIVAGYFFEELNAQTAKNIALEIHLSGANILVIDLEDKIKNKFLTEYKHILAELNLIMGEHGDLEKAYTSLNGEINYDQRVYKNLHKKMTAGCKEYLTENLDFVNLLIHDKFSNSSSLTST